VTAGIVDRNTSIAQKPDGGICGTETITVSFDGGGTLEIRAKFTGTPASAPGLYTLHETGWIENGTGAYSGAAGHVVVQGPFLFPDPKATPGAPVWISEIHGVIRGLS
jgi:hypothetical protein